MPGLGSNTIDIVQTAAIVMLVGAMCVVVLRGDLRSERQHHQIQDAIRSQYGLYERLNAMEKALARHEAQIDEIMRNVSAHDGQTEGRLRRLEGSNDPDDLGDV